MRKDQGSEAMREISDNIQEGSEGFFQAQYGTIFKLSFAVALGIMVVYYNKKP